MTFSNIQWEPRSRRLARRQEMFSMVSQWQQSGENQRRWCALHGIRLAKFQYWVRQFRDAQGDDVAGFVDLVPRNSEVVIEIHFPSGAVVKVPSSAIDWVRQLVG